MTPRSLFLVAFLFALAPLRTTVAIGQTGIVAVAAIIASVVLARSGREVVAGVMLGLATAVKIQIGLPFLLYVLWRRRWVEASTALAVLGGLTLVFVGRMAVAGVDWLPSWQANLEWFSRPGGLNDPAAGNPYRYSMVHLQYLFETLGVFGQWAAGLAIVLVAIAAGVVVTLIRGRYPRDELLALSLVAVLTLLVTYHRYYDAVLLALPLAWAFGAIDSARRVQAAIVLLLCSVFILPIPSNLWDLQRAGALPPSVVEHVLWEPVVLAHQVWALVLMAGILLWAAARNRVPEEPSPSDDGSVPGWWAWQDGSRHGAGQPGPSS